MTALTGHSPSMGAPYRCVGCFELCHRCTGETRLCALDWSVIRKYPWPLVWPLEAENDAKRFVYAIRDTLAGLVKIGVSHRPYGRMNALQQSHGSWLQMAAMSAGEYADEQALHLRFHEHRQLREWFVQVPEITTWIDEHKCVGHSRSSGGAAGLVVVADGASDDRCEW